ncbi:MAG: asparagine synthetase B [Ignavibacteriae bacterium]|nr:asparagine synthetase B [Ignavibacteriota bacterium]
MKSAVASSKYQVVSRKALVVVSCYLLLTTSILFSQTKLLIPMDFKQTDHLKAYGITFWLLEKNGEADWLLNYRGGSFMFDYSEVLARECRVRGVTFEQLNNAQASSVYADIQRDDNNMDVVRLEKAPKIAVYVPPNFKPWDDAVTLALEYAEIPYTKVWDEEVLTGKLAEYDWLHLHHEDFTGQYGKFYANYRYAPWYVEQQLLYEKEAKRLGFKKVSDEKKAVSRAIKEYIGSGGFMFAMCSATDSYDIALAAEDVDICDVMFDGDPPDPNAQQKLDFTKSLAFENFSLDKNPMRYEYSDIDFPASDPPPLRDPNTDYFTLFEFSAKYDPVPTMLTQNHVGIVRGFMGQTTAFRKSLIKSPIVLLAQKEGTEEVKYLHGNFGRGTFTWYGGHDPEDYTHNVGEPPTDLALYKNSPGYRLILNNVLFPAAKKKQQKT